MIKDSRYYLEACECYDCLDNEDSCFMDCDIGEECHGCLESKQAKDEAEFEEYRARGLL